jgi:site-specific DNA recombinase
MTHERRPRPPVHVTWQENPLHLAPAEGEAKKPVGIWLRVSTPEQAEGESPQHHEARARMYAEMKGWEVREVYHLEAVSGKSVLEHPEAKRMLDDVHRGQITGLIFSQLFRLGRNTRELLEISDFFAKHQADLISLAESIDTSTPIGRMYYTLTAAMGQCDREMTAARVAASIPIRAKLGKPLGGVGPFGYHWVEKKLLPHPEEAPVRRLIYDLFIEHRRLKTVARLMNDAGYRTRRGTKFTDTTIRRLLQDPTSKGRRRANYTQSTGDKKHWVPKPEEDWIWTDVPEIVDEATWETANQILAERKRAPATRPTKRVVHPFAGHTFCVCGTKMYVPHKGAKYTCGACRNKIPVVDLDRVFRERLRQFAVSEDEILAYAAKGDEALREKERLLAALTRDKAKITAERDKLYRLYLDDGLTSQGFGERNRPLEARLREIEEELPRLEGEVDFLKIEHLTGEEIAAGASDLYSRWPGMTPEEKRTLVETFVRRVTVGKDEISFSLYYFPSPSKIVANGQRSRLGSATSRSHATKARAGGSGRRPGGSAREARPGRRPRAGAPDGRRGRPGHPRGSPAARRPWRRSPCCRRSPRPGRSGAAARAGRDPPRRPRAGSARTRPGAPAPVGAAGCGYPPGLRRACPILSQWARIRRQKKKPGRMTPPGLAPLHVHLNAISQNQKISLSSRQRQTYKKTPARDQQNIRQNHGAALPPVPAPISPRVLRWRGV